MVWSTIGVSECIVNMLGKYMLVFNIKIFPMRDLKWFEVFRILTFCLKMSQLILTWSTFHFHFHAPEPNNVQSQSDMEINTQSLQPVSIGGGINPL